MAIDAVRSFPSERELPPWLIVVAASTDGIRAISRIVTALPKDFPAAVVVVQHRSPMVIDMLADILRVRAALPVEFIGHGQEVQPGKIYVGRPDLHLTIDRDRRFIYTDGRRIQSTLSSADCLLESAAPVFESRLIAVILTGRSEDGARGAREVRAHGGIVLVQDPSTVEHQEMPLAAIATRTVTAVLPVEEIGRRLIAIVSGNGEPHPDAEPALQW
jgi:two-component system chemotaxis response regulator CheB